MNRKFLLALGQMKVAGGRKEENLARAEAVIGEASRGGAQVVLLPECLDLGWTHPSSALEAEPVPGGAPYRRLAAAARKNGVAVCAGLTERRGDLVYNSAVYLDKDGTLQRLHRKINELDIAQPFYAQGDSLGAVETPWGVAGIMICADAFAAGQILSRSLGLMGADFILSPSAWAVRDVSQYSRENPYGAIWRENYRPVARDFRVWIAGVSNVGAVEAGPWKGKQCIGASLVFNPDGEEVLQGTFGAEAEEIIYTEITPEKRPCRGHSWTVRGN